METLEGGELCFPQLLNSSCRKLMRPHPEAVLLYILISSISLLTVALNLLVIISISHFRQLHTPTNLLLLSLAVSDLVVGVVKIPGEGSHFIGACWLLGDPLCASYHFIGFVIVAASVGNMVLISIDRYVAICDPLHYPTKITLRRIQISVCLCWFCSVFCNGLILRDHLQQPNKYNSCYGECTLFLDYDEGAVDLVVNFVGPIAVIIALYTRVFVVAVSQARAMRSRVVFVSHQSTGAATCKKSERKAARTLGVVVMVFLMCFCPFYFASFLAQDTLINVSSWNILSCLLFFNSCLNPVIYAFLYPWFKKAVKIIATLQILQPGSSAASVL